MTAYSAVCPTFGKKFFGRFMPKREKQAISHKGINNAADNSIETGDMVPITLIGDSRR